jgi:hypothetical protein
MQRGTVVRIFVGNLVLFGLSACGFTDLAETGQDGLDSAPGAAVPCCSDEPVEGCRGACLPGEVATCELPAETGHCRAAIPRWYHNSTTGECESFIYGGCGGNENNFATQEECEAACPPAEEPVAPPVEQPACEQPAETGHCRGAIPRWYHNSRTGECESFIYGGCGGNENNFTSQEGCEAACGAAGDVR